MPKRIRCRHCGDKLPSDCPPVVSSCKSYASWKARQRGDMLPADEADRLTLWAFFCAFYVATRDKLELIPDLD